MSRVPAGPTVSKVEGQSSLIRAPNGGPGIHGRLWGTLTQSCIDRRGLSLLSQRIQQPGAAVGPKLCLPYVYGGKFLGIQGKVAPRWHVSQMVNVELALKNSHCEVWPVAHSPVLTARPLEYPCPKSSGSAFFTLSQGLTSSFPFGKKPVPLRLPG